MESPESWRPQAVTYGLTVFQESYTSAERGRSIEESSLQSRRRTVWQTSRRPWDPSPNLRSTYRRRGHRWTFVVRVERRCGVARSNSGRKQSCYASDYHSVSFRRRQQLSAYFDAKASYSHVDCSDQLRCG